MNEWEETIKVSFPTDDGFTGRECPSEDCGKYFKVVFGTGLAHEAPCICPYCGHSAPHDQFLTKEQIKYIESIALSKVTGKIHRMLKKLERRPDPKAFLSIGIKVEGRPHPILHYTERDLEQVIVCEKCTLRYAIYGAFGFCPDCGVHNSLQILVSNFALVEKLLDLSLAEEPEIASMLIQNALEDVVSTFDGFGRELTKIHSRKSSNPSSALSVSFQNISKASSKIQKLFSIDLRCSVSESEWLNIEKCFQKRHLIAHKMGIIDEDYIKRTNEDSNMKGRRVQVTRDEVKNLVGLINKVSTYFSNELNK